MALNAINPRLARMPSGYGHPLDRVSWRMLGKALGYGMLPHVLRLHASLFRRRASQPFEFQRRNRTVETLQGRVNLGAIRGLGLPID